MSEARRKFRERMYKLRAQNRCTNCETKTKHFHHFADGHSLCCACDGKRPKVPKYQSDYRLDEEVKWYGSHKDV